MAVVTYYMKQHNTLKKQTKIEKTVTAGSDFQCKTDIAIYPIGEKYISTYVAPNPTSKTDIAIYPTSEKYI